MKKLLIVALACYGLAARAQVRESENFIYLYSDSVIYADDIRLRPDFSNSFLQLRVDSRRIPLQKVKFINNENGFFANIRQRNFGSPATFAERIIDGKINIFQENSYNPFIYDRHRELRNRRGGDIDQQMYYNKGYGDIKKLKYANLKLDMADDAQSMDMLEGYRKSIRTAKTLYIAGGASVVAGMIAFLATGNKGIQMEPGFMGHLVPSSKGDNYTASYSLLGLGFGLVTSGYLFNIKGLTRLERAVDTYNR